MNEPQVTPSPNACRVCGQAAAPFFTKLILRKHQVAYFKCPACGQVQTEPPYWLAEAYQKLSFQRDVGMVDRSIWTAKTTVALAHKLGIGPEVPAVDWGAGTGLFVRTCRDYGMNFFYRDPYATNVFAKGFETPAIVEPGNYGVITAFEVAEHFADPRTSFAELLGLRPDYLLISTLLYQEQGPGWWYFLPDGQHVAFYTRRSLTVLAEAFGYHLASDGSDIHLFSRTKISDRVLMRARRKREAYGSRYKKLHGSRIQKDFEYITHLLDSETANQS
jgi:hypothetical protein